MTSRACFKKDVYIFKPIPPKLTQSQLSQLKKKNQRQLKKKDLKKVEEAHQKPNFKRENPDSLFKISNFQSDEDEDKQASKPSKFKFTSDYHPTNSLSIKEVILNSQQKSKQTDLQSPQAKAQTNSSKHLPKDQKSKKRKQERTKKIKKGSKQGNFVRLDLKRKYEEKFRGGIADNKRKYTKNGRLKQRYRKPEMASEVQVNGEGLYNSFVHSLSSALTVTLALNENEKIEEKPLVDYKQYGFSRQQLKQLINKVFGYEDFRFGQYEVIKNILQYKSTLFISQTGSGKSLTYILSSLLCTGIAVVISPLISLMLDQVQKLPRQLPGVCIHSHLTMDQKQRIIKMISANKVKLIYITPQALETQLAYKMRSFPPISFVCIDEAHCISELSHNFRTSYLSIHELIRCNFRFEKEYCVLALTASANQQTAKSIMNKLQIKEYIRSSTLSRSNLILTASKDSGQKKYPALLSYIRSQPIRNLRGILIYCRTYYKVKQVCYYLKNSNISCEMFFSKLSQKQKASIIHNFREGKTRVIASTIALGMGLDFANLDSVIHLCMPSSMENYVQEIGRAGRRGLPAYCHLMLDEEDYLKERGYILSQKNDQEDLKKLFMAIKQHTFQNIQSRKECLQRLLEDSDQEIHFNHKNYKGKICYVSCKQLSQKLDIKQESLITDLLKIEQLSKGQLLKVLAPSYQSLKITLFRKNKKVIQEQSELFKSLLQTNDNKEKDVLYVNLISKCNKLKRIPSDLLGQIQAMSDQYYMRIQKKNNVFVWEYRGQMTFQEFAEKHGRQLVNDMKSIQDLRMLKLNIMYVVGSLNSYINMAKLIDTEAKKKQHRTGIQDVLDKYFTTPSDEFYNDITKGDHYLPIYQLERKSVMTISNLVRRFLTQTGVDNKKQMQRYMNGKVVTNILLGIGTPAFPEQTYKKEPYFGEFKNADYKELIGYAKMGCQSYMDDLEIE